MLLNQLTVDASCHCSFTGNDAILARYISVEAWSALPSSLELTYLVCIMTAVKTLLYIYQFNSNTADNYSTTNGYVYIYNT